MAMYCKSCDSANCSNPEHVKVEKSYKSKAQQGYMHAAAERGDIPESTVKEFDDKTKDYSKLPEHVKKHEKTSKAYNPEDDGDMSKVTQRMSKNLIAQLEDKESLHKALTAIAAAAIGREHARAEFKGFANPDVRAPKHLGETAARAVHVEPPPAMLEGSEYAPCTNCGTVIKSLAECPRCADNAKIVEAKDWRLR